MTNEYNNKVVTSSYSQEGHVYDVYVTVYSTVADVEGHKSRSIADHW